MDVILVNVSVPVCRLAAIVTKEPVKHAFFMFACTQKCFLIWMTVAK